jgi:hypothetical protein
MNADGFFPRGFEAYARQAGLWNSLPVPFELQGLRPDAWGLRTRDSLFAFAEAKTSDDINSRHTRTQLQVFGFTHMSNDARPCPLYLAIPRSSAYQLDRVLIDLGLVGARHVVRLHVPDVLLAEH